jgi:pre-rRNA-processing protein IPI3
MVSEEFFSSVCGPPITANTSISKDVGIYAHTINPSYGVKATFKKSSSPINGLAVSDTHVFAAQNEKSHVHVYSRASGKQEALIPFPERITCVALVDEVLVLGTAEGRLMLWEVFLPIPGISHVYKCY